MCVECHEAIELLSTIPWHIKSPIPAVQISDLAGLAMTAWLTDNHIDLLTWLINRRLEASDVCLLGSAYPNKMFCLCKASISENTLANNDCTWLNPQHTPTTLKGNVWKCMSCSEIVIGVASK